ncbi:MtaA/CmuA family methyltransferase [Candidatus Bathyarchaeota archaeon]|nr:MtaA/CmuA family methyltransferase [Candidatus Bathyarchaeota archaeon]
MRKFSYKRRVLTALLGGKVDRVPATSLAGCGGTVTVDMQDAVDIHCPEAHKDAEMMAKLAIASHELTGIENVRVPFDFVVEPEALGCKIRWGASPKSLPSVLTHDFEKPEDLKMPENLLEIGRIPVVLEAIRIVRKEVGDFMPISSLVLGPFTLAGELAGIERLLIWTVRKPDYVKKFIAFTLDVILEYAKAQYEAGSDIVQVSDPTASPELIGPVFFKQFVKPALTQIAESLGGPRLLHICGGAEGSVPDMAETGFDGISVDSSVDVARMKPLVGEVKVLGNVSSKSTLVFGSPDDVKKEARKALKSGVDFLEPGCGFSPMTPIENIKAMVEEVKE